MGREDGCEGRVEAIIRTNLWKVREILHLSEESQGISKTYGCDNYVNGDIIIISPTYKS